MKKKVVFILVLCLLTNTRAARAAEDPTPATNPSIIFSEVLANAVDEATGEFVELYNTGDEPVDLSGMYIADLGDTNDAIVDFVGPNDYGLPGLIVPAHGYAVVVDANYAGQYSAQLSTVDETSVIVVTTNDQSIGNGLGNTSDTISLYDATHTTLAQVSWTSDAGDGRSWKTLDISTPQLWLKSSSALPISPGAGNNELPVAHITANTVGGSAPLHVQVDGSASMDPEGQPLQFFWKIDGAELTDTENHIEHTFIQPGVHTILLTVADSVGAESTSQILVTIEAKDYNASVRINELLPNPTGDDHDSEFIELYNFGDREVDLAGFAFHDSNPSSVPYIFPPQATIAAKQFIVVTAQQSHITLNNDGETVYFVDPLGSTLHSAGYSGPAKEGKSLAYTGSEFTWAMPSPGQANTFQEEPPKDDERKPIAPSTPSPKPTLYPSISLSTARTAPDDLLATIQGHVIATPGTFGTRSIYISDGSSGLQIYSSSGFPKISMGQLIAVKGKISISSGEHRLLTKKDDISIQEQKKLFAPLGLRTGRISANALGRLVTTSGQLIENASDHIVINDGSGTVRIILSASGLKKPTLRKGQIVKITGVVGATSSGIVLRPRTASDFGNALHKTTSGTSIKKLPITGIGIDTGTLQIIAVLLSIAIVVIALRRRRRRTKGARSALRQSLADTVLCNDAQ